MKSACIFFSYNIFFRNVKQFTNQITNLLIVFGSFILVLTLGSCKKFVEVEPPTTQLVTTSVFSNNSTATSALTGIYIQMMNGPDSYNISLFTGLSADELSNYSPDPGYQEFYINALNAVDNPWIQNIWSEGYSCIYQADAIIEGVKNSENLTPAVIQQLTGEAKFLRAFWHFYLVNLFGEVPLVTTTDYKINSTASRTSKSEVYQQIIVDLNDARNLLNSNYVDASDTTITSERVRPTKWAASALLARVYLYTNDWVDAETQSTIVINNSNTYSLLNDLDSVFLANSNEAIWQLMPVTPGYNTWEGEYFILFDDPSMSASNTSTLSVQLLNSFDSGDNRRIRWVDSVMTNGNTFFYPYKYKANSSNSTAVSEYSMILRLAEQYLIRAEAEANGANGGINSAIADLNVIRNRAGLPNYPGAIDQNSVLKAIAHERQVELFTEWGHRWLDIKRTNTVDAFMGVVTPQKGGIWSINWQLYPIPQSERNSDPNLTQNTGY